MSCEKGSVLFEAALALPILLLITMLLYDYSRYLRTHWTLDHAAREAVLNGARLGEFQTVQTNLNVDRETYIACFNEGLIATDECKHSLVQWVALKVMEAQPGHVVEGSTVIETTGRAGILTVDVSADFDPILPWEKFIPLTLKVRQSASFLTGF